MSEFAPAWSNARMTPAQVRKYVKDMKAAQIIAEEKIKQAKSSWEIDKEKKELEELEKKLDNL